MKRQPGRNVDSPVDASRAETVNLTATSVGKRIKVARTALGLTQDKLAAMAGATSNRGLQDNEGGRSIPGGQMIGALVAAGVNANWLLTGEGEMLLQREEAQDQLRFLRRSGEPARVEEAGGAYDVARRILDPTDDDRRQMLLVMLRTAEHKLTEPMTREVAQRVLDLVAAWRPFAESDPALVARIEALRAAAEFYLAITG
ncbi:MAG: helix-turn-helix transcriptional regulator [Rhodocyclaceae bacterium]|nr:helix-turn-helix transcriptional regulator [Rhodocyclaceae bacterium]